MSTEDYLNRNRHYHRCKCGSAAFRSDQCGRDLYSFPIGDHTDEVARLRSILANVRRAIDWENTPYVECDVPCFALRRPVTHDETKAALDHWENHSVARGCSHGG